jgi:hypothetical protein
MNVFLNSKGKKLFIQVQDSSFDPKIIHVPQYLLAGARYNGGADKQYSTKGDDDQDAVPEGWVARRWDLAVQQRFQKLLFAWERNSMEVSGLQLTGSVWEIFRKIRFRQKPRPGSLIKNEWLWISCGATFSGMSEENNLTPLRFIRI